MSSSQIGVLFDVDGTLVDTNYLHTVAWSRALHDVGETRPMSFIHRLIGMGSDKLLDALIGREDQDVRDAHKKHFKTFWDELQAFPKAAELLREVGRRGATVVLASSANQEDFSVMRERIDADEAIDHATSADEVEQSKPSPDVFQVAMDGAGLEPETAIAVGDTVWDVEAAERCGVKCVAVLTGGISRAELEEAGAVAVYEDVGELLEQLDESPLGELLRKAG